MGTAPVVVVLVAVAAGAGGYLLGSTTGTPSPVEVDAGAENDRLRAEVASLRASLISRPPALAAGGVSSAPGAVAPASGSGATSNPGARVAPVDATAAPPALVLEDVQDVDELSRRLVAFLEVQMMRGAAGHLEVLKTLDTLIQGKQLQTLVQSDADGARVVYPLLRFAVHHESQVADFVETTFRTMAEDPKALEGLDDDTLEGVIEGFAPAMPAIGGERVARITAWTKQVLATPKGTLPKPVEQNRDELERLLVAWAPPLSSAEAVEKLRRPESLSQEELRSLLRRVKPEDVEQIDVVAIVGPLLDRGDYQAISLLSSMRVSDRDRVALDARARTALGRNAGMMRSYLQVTGRTTWDAVRPFVDEWIASGPDGRAITSLLVGYNPPAAYLQDLLARHSFDDATRARLEAMRKAVEGSTPR